MRRTWAPLLACVFALAGGCAGTMGATAPAMLPAQIPVRAFPTIWVAGGHLDHDEAVLERIATHLSREGQNDVRRVDVDQLEPMRQAGQIGAATVVMLVEVSIREQLRQSWDTTPVRVCGVFGCETRYQQVASAVPEVRGEVFIRVFEGPTARVLQRERVRLTHSGNNPEVVRIELVDALATRVESMLDVQRRTIDVELFKVDRPRVEQALVRIKAEDWEGGRELLEQEVEAGDFSGLPNDDQARVFYDLGLARRFAPGPGGPSDETFDGAARALRQAVRLAPRADYTQALRQLAAHRREHARLVEQRRAAQHNFALGQSGGQVPTPPPNYQAAQPAPQGAPAPPAYQGHGPPPAAPGPSEDAFEPE